MSSSTSMSAVTVPSNTERAECTDADRPSGVALRSASESAPTPERRAYNFGTGLRRDATIPESPRASRTVPGVSFADTGFEVVDGQDVFVAWFACPLDACDRLKTASEGKIVRCGDRALIKVKHPRRLGR